MDNPGWVCIKLIATLGFLKKICTAIAGTWAQSEDNIGLPDSKSRTSETEKSLNLSLSETDLHCMVLPSTKVYRFFVAKLDEVCLKLEGKADKTKGTISKLEANTGLFLKLIASLPDYCKEFETYHSVN